MIEFQVNNVKPCSINKAYIRGRSVLSEEARRYRKRLLITMTKIEGLKEQFENFTKSFNPLKDALKVSITILVPSKLYHTKAGNISRKSGDIGNYEKLTTDIICSSDNIKRHFKGYSGESTFSLNIDDQFIVHETLQKTCNQVEEWAVKIKIEKVSNKNSTVQPSSNSARFDESFYND